MSYVDGFVLVVPEEKIGAYRTLAQKAGKVWMEHGALSYHECVLEDGEAKGLVPFPKLAKAKEGETVVFAFITYKSRKDRDKINAKVMSDPRVANMCSEKDMPFDMKRMAYGGFKAIVAF